MKKTQSKNTIWRIPYTNYSSRFTRGISLLELLIYIALLAVIMVIISSSFISMIAGKGKAEAQSDVNSAIRFSLERLTQDIKSATSVTTPSCTPSCTADANSSATTLVMTIGGQAVVYDISGGDLRRTVGVSAPEPITASTTVNVVNTRFTRLENTNLVSTSLSATTTSIRIGISLQHRNTSPEFQYKNTATTTVTLR